jgi:hypothetical protein
MTDHQGPRHDPSADDDPGADVAWAVEAMSARFPAHADMLDMVANALTFGEGAGVLSQARVQLWLWDRLPRKWPEEEWAPAAVAAGLLFDGLDLPRYAAIARSETTRSVHAAWRENASRGHRAGQAAIRASGVEPPDTPRLAWGSLRGVAEETAFSRVEWALEEAIVDGTLKPGRPGAKAAALDVTERCLDEDVIPGFVGVLLRELVPAPASETTKLTRLELIRRERLGAWARWVRVEPLATWRAEIGRGLLEAPELPADLPVAAAIEPVRWLLSRMGDGVTLTERGYLPVALVREATDRFRWWPFDGRPRSEADVVEVIVLREVAMRAGLIAKRGKRMTVTRAALTMLDDPAALWRRAGSGVAQDGFDLAVAEAAALRLLREPDVRWTVATELVPLLEGLGWRDRSGPLDHAVTYAYARLTRAWEVLGCVVRSGPRWVDNREVEPSVIALTPLGRVAAMQLLHDQALGPRSSPFG